MSQHLYRIPDVLQDWPWTRHLNPHFEEGKRASEAWLETFKPFTLRGQMAFDKCDFGMFTKFSCDMVSSWRRRPSIRTVVLPE